MTSTETKEEETILHKTDNENNANPVSACEEEKKETICSEEIKSETNVKNALGAAIFPQENQAIEQQKLEGVKFRQIQNVKPQQPLHHKSKLGLSSGNSNSSLANKTQNEDRKVRESAAPTPITQFATEIGSIHQSISSKDWLAVRKLQVPQKVKSFVWRCLQNALATQEQLVKRGCKEDATCPICGIGNESIEHALFLCSKASMVWFGSSLNIRCQAIENMNFKAWWKQMLQVLRVEDSDYRLELAVIQCWQIWKHRNNEVFNGLIYDPKQVVSKAYNQWRKWISCNSKSVTEATLPTMEKRGKPQLTLTRPKEPEFETAQRVRSVKIKSSAELEEEMMAKIPKFKARPVNKKIFEAPTLPALPRSTPRLPEFKEFHLQTAARANQNAETASIASTEVSHQSQWKPHHLTEPKSPLLHTTLRARPTMVKSSLEIEKEELEKIPKFKARPLNKKFFLSNMVEESLQVVPFDRTVEQAILALKKGAHLLKCGRRGKPKFCPFRLSTDEKYLIWYSGQEERQLRLSSVMNIVTGQRTVNFQRQLQSDKEHQSFSLIYANGERSLDLICKDKEQVDSWFIGLRAVISRCHRSRPFTALGSPKSHRSAQSCVNSPAGYIRRKHNLGIHEDGKEFSQVRSLCGSPTQSLSERCISDGLSLSSDSFCLSESSILQMQDAVDVLVPNSPCVEPILKKCGSNYVYSEFQKDTSLRFAAPSIGTPQIGKNDILKDVLIWGEGVKGGSIGGMVQRLGNQNVMQVDSLVPKLLESTAMLDVRSLSLGGKHVALVTKRGEVFCWGEGSRGKLGHKVNMDVSYPKAVESLDGVDVKSVSCGEYQTCALTHSGELYTWGDNRNGASLVDEVRARSQWFPYKLSGPFDGITISKVACGVWHTAIVSSSGQLFTYGDGTFGVLGHGSLQSFSQPKEVESLKGLWVKTVACGSWHTAAIVDIIADCFKYNAVGGKLFTWGDGDRGRLGHSGMERKLVPTCVTQLVDYDFVQVSCGRMMTVALSNTGKVYTMGSSVHGQLGHPQAKDKSITIIEGKLKEEFVKEISSGSYHVAVLTSGGNVYTWGKGANGQLGLGNIEDRNSPTFVEALRDRQVQSIACGSNLTAAICLHKSISVTDQSSCSGCKMPFGLTRKKHNCYNCGVLLCNTCSSKKVINASLAPNKSKPSRVCDSCFNHLQKVTLSDRMLKPDTHGSKQLLSPHKLLSNDKEGKGEGTPPVNHMRSVSRSYNQDSPVTQKKTPKNQGEQQELVETVSSLSPGLPRWGQVSCPALFESYHSKPVPPVESKASVSNAVAIEGMFESNMMLTEEVQRLRAQARNLEMQCEIGNQKIQECQETIERTWSLAREEGKAANEIIKALALRLHAMSEKISAGGETKVGVEQNISQDTLLYKDIPSFVSPRATLASLHLPTEVKLPKDRHLDSLSSSPIVFSNTLKSMDGGVFFHENGHGRSEDASQASRADPKQNGTKGSRLEWVEQYEPGVYITFTVLPGGQKGLKRVRFSRKRFAEKEAERWWEENQVTVYQKYGIEGYANLNQKPTKS